MDSDAKPGREERHRNKSKRGKDLSRTAYLQSRVSPELLKTVKRASDATEKPIADLVAISALEFSDMILRIKENNPSLKPHEIYSKATALLMAPRQAFSK